MEGFVVTTPGQKEAALQWRPRGWELVVRVELRLVAGYQERVSEQWRQGVIGAPAVEGGGQGVLRGCLAALSG